MAFIQTISYRTTRPDEIQALAEKFNRDNPDALGLIGTKVLKDRDRGNAYLIIAEFENYEIAMENSARPETDAFAKQMGELIEGAPEQLRRHLRRTPLARSHEQYRRHREPDARCRDAGAGRPNEDLRRLTSRAGRSSVREDPGWWPTFLAGRTRRAPATG
jgi:hypothetical protein